MALPIFRFKACKKCGGDVVEEKGEYRETVRHCIQCGWVGYVDAIGGELMVFSQRKVYKRGTGRKRQIQSPANRILERVGKW